MTRHALTAALLLCASLCCAQAVTLPPSAEELSKPGELQDWIITSLELEGRCTLPKGVIRTDAPVVLNRIHGGVIEGCGPSYAATTSKSGWLNKTAVIQATTTIVATDPSKPAIILDAVKNLELRNFGVETDGVGIAYTNPKGWGSQGNYLHRLAFHGCDVAFKAGEKATDHNASDVTFSGCQFYRCGTGLEINHQQGVNFTLESQCFFGYCRNAVVANEGGFIDMLGCRGFAVERWLTINGGGSNLQPSRITHLYSDRTPKDPPPVIVDASGTDSVVRVIVDGVKVTQHGDKDSLGKGHSYYREGKATTIRVRDDAMNTYPPGGITEPSNRQEP